MRLLRPALLLCLLLAASVLLTACHGPGGSWATWEIVLVTVLVVVLIIVLIVVFYFLGVELALALLLAFLRWLAVTITEWLVWLIEVIITFIVETAWPWLLRIWGTYILPLLQRIGVWIVERAWPAIVRWWTTKIWPWMKWLWLFMGGNALWDWIKSGWNWLWGGGPPTTVYPPMTLPCPGAITLVSVRTATESENDYPFGKTGAMVAASATASAIASATAAANADLAAQAAAISCAGGCQKVLIGPTTTATSSTPPTKVSYLGGLYDTYTVTATVTAILVVQCQ